MLVILITLAHFPVSSAMNLPDSTGVISNRALEIGERELQGIDGPLKSNKAVSRVGR